MIRQPPGETRDQVFGAVVSLYRRNGLAPTVREIGRALGIRSTSAVAYQLDRLIWEGRLKRVGPQSASRAIVPVDLDNWTLGGLIVHLEHLCAGRDAVPVAELLRLVDELAGRQDPVEQAA